MKIKQSPDDFQVEERTDAVGGPAGRFALYRLEKVGWTTPDALAMVRRRWRVHHSRVSYGGLKDRHAKTVQYVTIANGPQRDLRQHGVAFTFLGRRETPFTSADIRANWFRVVVRDLASARIEGARTALAEVAADGLPNYFDDQRFGSVSGGEFVAKLLVLERYEDALKQALAAPYEFDHAAQKQEKATLRAHWGDWPAAKAKLPRSHARSLVDYLVSHPTDFRGAIARLRPELGGLYLSAFQSHLWNRTLAAWLRGRFPADRLIGLRLKLDEVPVPRALSDAERAEVAEARLPLPSARLRYDDAVPAGLPGWPDALGRVLADEGLALEQLKIRGPRMPFFSRGERPAWFRPADVSAADGPDDRHPGRVALTLAFELPRGCYATLVVKRVTQGG